jgi:ABC-2 type transport system ATP-binding protein
MLKAENLRKLYGSHVALKSLNLEVKNGEVYALLGPNGAGKTTTINCFLGFIRPEGGRASVAGFDPAIAPEEARRALAYIPEQVNLYGTFSGLENLGYFSELGGIKWDKLQLKQFLVEAGLQREAFDRPVSGYSKGMRQKVGIAIALAKNAKAILLDEPTSGLDPRASYEFSELLKKMRGNGVAILMATHDIFRALDVATRVGIMQDGELRTEVSTSEISPSDLEALYLNTVRQEIAA